MYFQQPIRYAENSDLGCKRSNNEDSCGLQMCSGESLYERRGHLFVVADGMGGHAVGELASKTAVDTVLHTYMRESELNAYEALKSSVENANDEVHRKGNRNRDFQRMGTTCSALSLTPKGAIVGHVGDSRVYRIREDQTEQLTFDHSLLWETFRKKGLDVQNVKGEEPKNVITRCLGPGADVEIDMEGPHLVHPGDVYVLCSDGLTNYVNDHEIGVVAGALPAEEASQLLINLACTRGGSDNVTVIVVQVASDSGEKPLTSEEVALEKSAQFRRSQVGRWVGVGILGVIVLIGGGISLIGKAILGATLALPSLLALFGMILWIRRAKRKSAESVAVELENRWKPYRVTDCRVSRSFMDSLTETVRKVHDLAVRKNWGFDAEAEAKAGKTAAAEIKSRHPKRAILALAGQLDLLLSTRPTQEIPIETS